MSKKVRNRQKANKPQRKSRSHRKTIVVIGLILCLGLTSMILAQWRATRVAGNTNAALASSPLPQPQPSLSPANPSKEYIYAGGKLIATEEPALAYNSSFISPQLVNSAMTVGGTYTASITLKNIGTESWPADGSIKLFSKGVSPALPPTSPVDLPNAVGATQQVTFNISITAPSTPGRYNFRWQLKRNNVDFGVITPNVSVLVRTDVPEDFDGDGKADIVVFRPSEGNWYVLRSTDNAMLQQYLMSASDDKLVPADYDGDKHTDLAVWNPTSHNWHIKLSSTQTTKITGWGSGALGDISVPADYDGDGKADMAVYRPSDGNWYILQSSQNDSGLTKNWGGVSGDIPVPGDYDGDGKADTAVYRPSEGNWHIKISSNGAVVMRNWGASGDKLVPADYDGDGKTDIAVYRSSEGKWYIINSSDDSTTTHNWGAIGDKLVPADYDGDGRTDVAVWRESEGVWYVIKSSDNTVTVRGWGAQGDIPVPTVYVRP